MSPSLGNHKIPLKWTGPIPIREITPILTQWGLNKMADILQKTFCNKLNSWLRSFQIKFQCVNIGDGNGLVPSGRNHYLNQWWPRNINRLQGNNNIETFRVHWQSSQCCYIFLYWFPQGEKIKWQTLWLIYMYNQEITDIFHDTYICVFVKSRYNFSHHTRELVQYWVSFLVQGFP